ncbi:uncharacterized protein [Choristoneura fumiferana]|uniref:uncharacterized protein n=1 Tax=Choristoneura fumiferana TaxID=7141 RepID=UPI003D159B45
MYKGINTLMQKTADDIGNSNTVFLLTNYSMVTISMLYTGQMAQNEADSMRRALARLYNILVTIPGDDVVNLRKSVRDLYRYISVEPFRNQIITGVFIQMPLLPVILTTIVSNTIILLQFNHVV